MRTDTIKFRTE